MKPLLAPLALLLVAAAPAPEPDRSIAQTEADLAAGRITSVALVRHYLARIAAVDKSGPRLNAVLALNPHALADAAHSDALRKAGQVRGALEGVPILIKDNIDSADPLPTTAGSFALAANVTHRDAPLVARLRAAGAIILGKTNLSEWANMRSPHSTSGWSGKGMHTTTFAEMFDLPAPTGGRVIDTPGMREFGLVDISRQELSHYYPEMARVLNDCQFNNCLHINEPGCAVKEAVAEGKINEERYISYYNILESIDERTY